MKTKKTNRYLKSVIGAIVAVSAALVLSCEQPGGSPPGGALPRKGSVAITVSTGSPAGSVLKTVLPTEMPAFTKYDLVFKTETKTLDTVTKTPEELKDGYQQELDAGDWTVTVTAYRKFTVDKKENDYPAARGSVKITVATGETKPGEVVVSPIPLDDTGLADLKGIFTYDVTYPDGATGTLTLTPQSGEPTTVDLSDNDGSDANKLVASKELAPGYYKLSIILTNANKLTASVSEWVHIYAGLESKDAFTFAKDDFTDTVYLAVTIPTMPEGVTFKGIEVYEDDKYSEKVDEAKAKVVGTEWVVGVPAAKVGNKLYLKSETKKGDITYTAKGSTVTELTEEGAEGIALNITLSGTGKASDVATAINTFTGKKAYLNGLTITTDTGDLTGAIVTVTGTVKVENGATVTFDKNSDLTVDGTLNVAGTLAVAGTLTKTGTIAFTDNGSITLEQGATYLPLIGADYTWDSEATDSKVTLTGTGMTLLWLP